MPEGWHLYPAAGDTGPKVSDEPRDRVFPAGFGGHTGGGHWGSDSESRNRGQACQLKLLCRNSWMLSAQMLPAKKLEGGKQGMQDKSREEGK